MKKAEATRMMILQKALLVYHFMVQ